MIQNDSTAQAGWNFDNSYARLPQSLFTFQNPVPVKSPKMIVLNSPLAASLGLNTDKLQTDESVAVLAGNLVPKGSLPLAQAYAGHQYGYSTVLGDGRALLLGEQITPEGSRFDIQLKGSGQTPYSRQGDGRASLGPMLREYIISEAMHALGIPTTRSLSVVSTGEPVFRETIQPGAVLTRVAASHIRVGTFEYAANQGSVEILRQLADYTLQRHFPEVDNNENRYLSLLREIIKRQAFLIAKWQLAGFIHGVMNTDNMAVSGETIDYGPCAFMDMYDPATVFSSIDRYGRYAYGNQPSIAQWNLAVFAETLLPLLDKNRDKAIESAQAAVSEFSSMYDAYWLNGMRAKLGIFNKEKEDISLAENLLDLMLKNHADFTNTFRSLANGTLENTALFGSDAFSQWLALWQQRLSRQTQSTGESMRLMKNNSPALIPRNHLVEEALDAAVQNNDYSEMENLLDVLSRPYEDSAQQTKYTAPPPLSNDRYRTYCGT